MLYFITGLLLLAAGYFCYGKLVERLIGPDDRPVPSKTRFDGVDFLPLPHWKNMLIQLLNIAGIGPVIGVILGVKFGEIVFLIIPIGNIIGGAVHDYFAGMMSIRDGGANMPAMIRKNLGKRYAAFFSWFMVLLLLLVVAVFINIPAQLLSSIFTGDQSVFWLMVGIIFAYYIAATLFPVDKIIGAVYPLFGAVLILSAAAIMVVLLFKGWSDPALLAESAAFQAAKFKEPILPMLFVTIACGILSGFHATQSPIIARTVSSERQGRQAFYGMMVLEGVIAMIWAAGALAIYNRMPDTLAMAPAVVLKVITSTFLGKWMGMLTVIGVVILAITSGDTACRSLRLSLAEMCSVDQKSLRKRVLLCLPILLVVSGLLAWSNVSAKSFNYLWNYFAWGNQVLGASMLLAAVAWLKAQGKPVTVALVPGAFMTFIILAFILYHPTLGLGMNLQYAYMLAGAGTFVILMHVLNRQTQES